ncbi:hypothetical protein VPHPS32B4_0045 [Vibrio phage PS32B-4]
MLTLSRMGKAESLLMPDNAHFCRKFSQGFHSP